MADNDEVLADGLDAVDGPGLEPGAADAGEPALEDAAAPAGGLPAPEASEDDAAPEAGEAFEDDAAGLEVSGDGGAEGAEAPEAPGESEGEDDESEDELESEGDIAADYLEELLDIADLDGDIDTFTEGDRAHVSIMTDSDQLVGKDGVVLDALQELTRLAVLTETGRHSRLMLDVAGFREKRRKQLQQLALDAVNEVKASGEAVRLAAMNPFERKIVHDVVAANGLVSESEGVEPQRRVVILPAAGE